MHRRIGIRIFYLVVAQFAATSLWFAGNAVYKDVSESLNVSFDIVPGLTIAVQLGFILGTLTYALLMIPDRFSPAKVFLISSICGAFFNFGLILFSDYWLLFITRALVGFFLAGVYPVGMKIAADWAKDRLGNALGFLVGALVLGTSFPHLIRSLSIGFSWQWVTTCTSLLALLAGLMVNYLVGDGPDRKKAKALNLGVAKKIFQIESFRNAAFGYFGHMWELYTFWAFIPAIISIYNSSHNLSLNVSLWSFLIIAIGGFGCAIGGYYSKQFGSGKVAFMCLVVSFSCGLLSFLFIQSSTSLLLSFLLIWGFFVIPDSPQFSTLVARYAPQEYLGSALTIVNCIGFGLTIVSIQLMSQLDWMGSYKYVVLALGPFLGLYPAFRLMK